MTANKKTCEVCKKTMLIKEENKVISSSDFKAHYWCNDCIKILFEDDEDSIEEDDDL